MLSYSAKLAVSIFRNFNKAIVIIIEFCNIAIRKHLCNSFPAALEAAFHIINRNVVTTTLDPILNPLQALVYRIQANVEQSYEIT